MAPESVVISGERGGGERGRGSVGCMQGRRVHRLAVSHAFHSALMEPMLEEFAAVVATVFEAVHRGLRWCRT